MRKSSSFKRADSRCEVQPVGKSKMQKSRDPKSRREFLRMDSVMDEEKQKDRRKKRRSRKSVNGEENSEHEDDSPRDDDYKIEVMRRLMIRFSLDDTIKYYRSINSAEYTINPNDFSLDSSVHAKQLKKRLKHLLGSEVIKVNDKEFMDGVERKLLEERQMLMTRREQERVENERQRLRRLMSEGYISAKQMREDKLMVHDWDRDQKRSSKKSASHSSYKSSNVQKYPVKKKAQSKSITNPSASSRMVDTEDEVARQYTLRYSRPNTTYRAHSEMGNSLFDSPTVFEVESQMSRMSKREGTSTDSGICDSSEDLLVSPEPQNDSSEAAEANQSFNTVLHRKFKDPSLVQLHKEESLVGMYRLAERILPDDRPRSYFDTKQASRLEKRL